MGTAAGAGRRRSPGSPSPGGPSPPFPGADPEAAPQAGLRPSARGAPEGGPVTRPSRPAPATGTPLRRAFVRTVAEALRLPQKRCQEAPRAPSRPAHPSQPGLGPVRGAGVWDVVEPAFYTISPRPAPRTPHPAGPLSPPPHPPALGARGAPQGGAAGPIHRGLVPRHPAPPPKRGVQMG